MNQIDHVGFSFLLSDLELALTMTRIAANGGNNTDKRKRNQSNARRAYDSVQKLTSRVLLTGEECVELEDMATRVESELEKLGETF